MANGIVIIDKPQDWTSMDVCAKLRGKLREKRIGHAGTLDPMATGVLPVFVGRATRAVEFAVEGEKEYVAGLRLGVATDTQDTTGTVLETRPVSVTVGDLERVLEHFRGDILQIPPMYSAIKKDGKKLYELARKGVEVERAPRPVTIFSLTVEGQTGAEEYTIRVRCSKGTYIRTLCHDIGAMLGCGGAMCSLRRTMACGFTIQEAVPLAEFLATEDPEGLLMPVESYFAGRPILLLKSQAVEKQIRNGMAVPMADVANGEYRVYGQDKTFLALSKVENGILKTIKSFYEV